MPQGPGVHVAAGVNVWVGVYVGVLVAVPVRVTVLVGVRVGDIVRVAVAIIVGGAVVEVGIGTFNPPGRAASETESSQMRPASSAYIRNCTLTDLSCDLAVCTRHTVPCARRLGDVVVYPRNKRVDIIKTTCSQHSRPFT